MIQIPIDVHFLIIVIFVPSLGLYGNDDLHNGLLEVLTAGRKVDNLVSAVRNQVIIDCMIIFLTVSLILHLFFLDKHSRIYIDTKDSSTIGGTCRYL